MFDLMAIDGNNLIHSDRNHVFGSPSADFSARREGVVRLAEQMKGVLAERIVVVFDGRGDETQFAGGSSVVEVIFASENLTADGVIERMISKYEKPFQTLVISSDKAEARNIVAAGGQVMSCEVFLDQVSVILGNVQREIKKASSSMPPQTLGDFFPQR